MLQSKNRAMQEATAALNKIWEQEYKKGWRDAIRAVLVSYEPISYNATLRDQWLEMSAG